MKVPYLQLSNSFFNYKTIPAVILLMSVLVLSVVSGVLAAFGNVIHLIALLGVYGIVFVIAAPTTWTVWIIFIMVFLISGPSAYFIRFTQLQWFNVLVSAALILPLILHILHSRRNILYSSASKDLILPAIFLLLVIFSTIIDRPQFADFVNASRHYFWVNSRKSDRANLESASGCGSCTIPHGSLSIYLCFSEKYASFTF